MEITLPELAERYYHLVKDVYIHAFTLVVFLDVFTGIAKAFVTKKLNSTINRRGLIEHIIVCVMCITVYPYLLYLGFNEIATAFLLFFTLSYCLSLIENLSALGVPFPTGLKKRLEKLRDELDGKELEDEKTSKNKFDNHT
jgi:toxin secretion/phage lysis holin